MLISAHFADNIFDVSFVDMPLFKIVLEKDYWFYDENEKDVPSRHEVIQELKYCLAVNMTSAIQVIQKMNAEEIQAEQNDSIKLQIEILEVHKVSTSIFLDAVATELLATTEQKARSDDLQESVELQADLEIIKPRWVTYSPAVIALLESDGWKQVESNSQEDE